MRSDLEQLQDLVFSIAISLGVRTMDERATVDWRQLGGDILQALDKQRPYGECKRQLMALLHPKYVRAAFHDQDGDAETTICFHATALHEAHALATRMLSIKPHLKLLEDIIITLNVMPDEWQPGLFPLRVLEDLYNRMENEL